MKQRIIKFRAWDKKEKEECEVLAIRWDITEGIQIALPLLENGRGLRWLHISKVELREFTGLLDKNGKEIFEGDIVEVWDNQGATAILGQGKIVWNIEEVCFEVEYPKGNTEIIDNAIRMKIIGNIYENPELLNQRSKR